jgi:hypothetical protein
LDRPVKGDRYATTIRTYDPAIRAWRVIFVNPASPETNAQLTRDLLETTSKWKDILPMAHQSSGDTRRSWVRPSATRLKD